MQPPFSPAEGLLTVSRSGMLYTERFTHRRATPSRCEVPIEEAHIPNLSIQVDLVGAAPRTDDRGEALPGVPDRPAYATGQLDLSIPPLQRTLTLAVTPQQRELEPGGETTLDLLLTDAGRPAGGRRRTGGGGGRRGDPGPDQLPTGRPAGRLLPGALAGRRQSNYGRASIVLANPEAIASQALADQNVIVEQVVEVAEEVQVEGEAALLAAPMATAAPSAEMGSRGLAGEPQPIRVRSDFNPLATFAPEVRTDAAGRARSRCQLPDNLTRYRVMVVAVAGGKQFGSGEANLTARLPLMVRPFRAPLSQLWRPLRAARRAAEPDRRTIVGGGGGAGRQPGTDSTRPASGLIVPARDRIEVRFPATTVMPGTARLQIAAVSGTFADAATIELPVYTPATTEAFATYGVVDEGAIAQPVAAPDNVFPQFGGLEISTSSTALQALTDAVLYLVSYRFECSEQLASRILAVAALRDVLTAFSAEGLPSPGRDGGGRAARHRAAGGDAERRRRLPLLAARPRVDPLQQHPRRPRAAAGRDDGLSRPGAR